MKSEDDKHMFGVFKILCLPVVSWAALHFATISHGNESTWKIMEETVIYYSYIPSVYIF